MGNWGYRLVITPITPFKWRYGTSIATKPGSDGTSGDEHAEIKHCSSIERGLLERLQNGGILGMHWQPSIFVYLSDLVFPKIGLYMI